MDNYKNPSLPVEERVKDLLSRMTLEEKAAQMDMIRGVELAEKVHKAHFVQWMKTPDFNGIKCGRAAEKEGWASYMTFIPFPLC